jgi:hypothetical protein
MFSCFDGNRQEIEVDLSFVSVWIPDPPRPSGDWLLKVSKAYLRQEYADSNVYREKEQPKKCTGLNISKMSKCL